MKKSSISIQKKILIFNAVVVAIVVFITALTCMMQFRQEIIHQANASQDRRLKMFWALLRQKGTDMRISDGRLMVGNYVINGNFELPDRLKEITGSVATIFMNDERISTNVMTPDGKRAIGTKLSGPAYDALFKKGQPYHGEAQILKETYFVAYDPIKNSKGEVIGALFVGAKSSNLLSAFLSIMITIIIVSTLLVIVTSLLNYFVFRKLLDPLTDAAVIVGKVAEGDLTVKIVTSSDDEVGQVLNSMDKMVQNLKHMIGQIKSSADTMASGSEQLRLSAGKISSSVNSGASQANQIAASAEELSQTVIDIAKNSSNIAASSSEAAQTAREGEDVVNRSVSETEKISDAVSQTSAIMMTLGERSQEIGAIVEVIKDIADQTNLLALNAAIEAARAGEQGRGFAVVADEVRKLAERTAKSTAQISEMITAIQQEVDKAVDAMDGAFSKVETGVKLSREAGQSLSTIVQNVNDLQGMVQQIASATEEMSTVSEHISSDIQLIANSSKETSVDANQIADASSSLAQISASMQALVSKFKI